jgi:hypothetical protein
VTDYFTRFAEAYSLPDIEATTVADKLLTEFICRFSFYPWDDGLADS